MSQPTPENIRFHAAGHLAAAELIATTHPEAARQILSVVLAYATAPGVSSPPALIKKLSAAAMNPGESVTDIKLLENWFCHPLNTVIEKSDGKF